jgi:hypothetical protein
MVSENILLPYYQGAYINGLLVLCLALDENSIFLESSALALILMLPWPLPLWYGLDECPPKVHVLKAWSPRRCYGEVMEPLGGGAL